MKEGEEHLEKRCDLAEVEVVGMEHTTFEVVMPGFIS